jgi:hypothetical protein
LLVAFDPFDVQWSHLGVEQRQQSISVVGGKDRRRRWSCSSMIWGRKGRMPARFISEISAYSIAVMAKVPSP